MTWTPVPLTMTPTAPVALRIFSLTSEESATEQRRRVAQQSTDVMFLLLPRPRAIIELLASSTLCCEPPFAPALFLAW